MSSRKHAYIILTPFNPILYSKTEVYRGIRYVSYLCSGEAVLTSTHNLCFEQEYGKYQKLELDSNDAFALISNYYQSNYFF